MSKKDELIAAMAKAWFVSPKTENEFTTADIRDLLPECSGRLMESIRMKLLRMHRTGLLTRRRLQNGHFAYMPAEGVDVDELIKLITEE